MKMKCVIKKGAGTLALAVVAGAMLVPFQSAVSIPVPVHKPAASEYTPTAASYKQASYQPFKMSSESYTVPAQRAKTTFRGFVLSKANLGEKYGALSDGGVLSSSDANIYRAVFALQTHGKISEADAALRSLSDDSLMGHVLYQRYMHPAAYKSTYKELERWLVLYADHPGASDIYDLALKRRTSADTQGLAKPRLNKKVARIKNPTIHYAKAYVPQVNRTSAQALRVKKFSRRVRALVRSGHMQEALALYGDLQERKWMGSGELDRLQAHIASGFFYDGDYDLAYALASQSAARSGVKAPLAGWIAGLSLWKKGEYASAPRYFKMTANSAYTSGWMASAGAFWAARSYEKIGSKVQQRTMLAKAAKHSRTFYGLLAGQALGQNFDFNWSLPAFTKEHKNIITKTKAGRRALALVAAGQNERAEKELLRLQYKGNNKLRTAVLAYANRVGLPGIAMRLGRMIKLPGDRYYDSALYPLSPWSPEDGYAVDPALVHAVIRQESRFETDAKSHRGALGLMQIMPDTANYMSSKRSFSGPQGHAVLSIPAVNIKVGQDYLSYLLKTTMVQGDIVSLVVSYNAGPGNLQRWKKRNGMDDPLLFIEMIPIGETREYVERVLSNYWIYRLRGQEETPTLTALSAGKMARYAHMTPEKTPYKLASANK